MARPLMRDMAKIRTLTADELALVSGGGGLPPSDHSTLCIDPNHDTYDDLGRPKDSTWMRDST